ncbi:hypothetical protein VTN02DRAFT_4660 [Thermoascus thermophilus]
MVYGAVLCYRQRSAPAGTAKARLRPLAATRLAERAAAGCLRGPEPDGGGDKLRSCSPLPRPRTREREPPES